MYYIGTALMHCCIPCRRGAKLKMCVIKGYNWSVKGPTKNLYSYTGGGMPLGHTKFLRPHNL